MEVWIRQSMPYYYRLDEPTPFPVPGWMWDRARGEDLYAQRLRYLQRMDKAGFDAIIFTEHHYGPNGGLTPSPLVALAAATQVTERIKLVTMGIALALYPHPVRVAEELAMGQHFAGMLDQHPQQLVLLRRQFDVPVTDFHQSPHQIDAHIP